MNVQTLASKKLISRFQVHYGLIQGFYWMAWACLVGFAAVLLQGKSFSLGTVGIVLAVSNVISVVLQPKLASLVDRNPSIKLKNVIAVLTAAAVLCVLFLYLSGSNKLLIVLFFVAAGMIHITSQSLVNALGMETIEKGIGINYGLGRGIGSISFAVLTLVLGELVERTSVDTLLFGYLLLGGIMALLCAFYRIPVQEGYSKSVSGTVEAKTQKDGVLGFFHKYPAFCLALVGMVCMHASHALINNYLISIAEKCGGSSGVTGVCMGIASATELPMLILFDRIVKHVKVERVLQIAAIGFAVKSGIALFATSVPLLYLSQFCQLFAYALYLPALVHFSRKSVKVEDMVQGQAYAGIAMSIAGVSGSLGGGFLVDGVGVNGMLIVAVVLPLLGLLIFTASRRKKV